MASNPNVALGRELIYPVFTLGLLPPSSLWLSVPHASFRPRSLVMIWGVASAERYEHSNERSIARKQVRQAVVGLESLRL